MEPPPLSSINRARQSLVRGLAESFLSGRWDIDGLTERGSQVLGRRYRWLRPLARRVLASFPEEARPRVARLADFLWADEPFRKACRKHPLALHFHEWPLAEMAPAPGPPASWQVPAITSPAGLAGFLELEPAELDWFADCQARERSAAVEPLRHYRYRWVAKPSGSRRLIEAPKPRLKQLQRRLLDEIMVHIPPHEAAHGFRPGRSVLSFVEPHVGQTIVLKMDLRDFFVSITSGRVMAIFLTAGYPEPVARLLTGLCTNTVPLLVWNQEGPLELDPSRSAAGWQARRLYRQPHLPQGAPTSPALANLAAHRLDYAAGRSRTGCRGQLYPLCRRPGFLGRRVVRPVDRPVPDPRRGDRPRRGLCRPASQDASHEAGCPATCGRGRDQSEDQYRPG